MNLALNDDIEAGRGDRHGPEPVSRTPAGSVTEAGRRGTNRRLIIEDYCNEITLIINTNLTFCAARNHGFMSEPFLDARMKANKKAATISSPSTRSNVIGFLAVPNSVSEVLPPLTLISVGQIFFLFASPPIMLD